MIQPRYVFKGIKYVFNSGRKNDIWGILRKSWRSHSAYPRVALYFERDLWVRLAFGPRLLIIQEKYLGKYRSMF